LPKSFSILLQPDLPVNQAVSNQFMISLLALLFLFAPATHSESHLDQQIETYLNRTGNPEHRSEALWSLIQIYRESDAYRERLFRIADRAGATWFDPLREVDGDEVAAFHDLVLRFGDEHLLLYLQLQIYPEEDRNRYVEEFYSRHETGSLELINREIAESGRLSIDSIQLNEWDFSIFLLLYHSNRIHFTDEQGYEVLANGLETMINTRPEQSQIERDFLYASLFRIHYRLDRFRQISDYSDRLARLQELPLSSVLRDLYVALDFALYRAGYIDRSLEIQRRHSLPISELLEDRATQNQILATHGGYLYTIGRFSEARNAFTRALRDSSYNSPAIQTRLLNNLGLVYFKLGDVDRYIETQMQALDFAVDQQNYNHQLSIYRNLHIYYRKNQNWDLAERYIEEARLIAEVSGNRDELTSILISMAVYYNSFLHDSDRAFELLNEAEALLEEENNYLIRARTLTEKADLYKQAGRHEESREIYRVVVELGAENRNDRMYLGALVDLAGVELKMGNSGQASTLLREVNAHDITLIDFPELVNARRIEAEIAFRNGDRRMAEDLLSRILGPVLERARSTTDFESGYWNVEPAYLQFFEVYSDLLIRERRYPELANLLDQLKTINDVALIENPLVQGGRLSEEELTENRRIAGELDHLRKQYLIAGQEKRLPLQREMATLTAQRNLISRSDTRILFEPVAIGSIQESLRRNEMVLHITRILDHFYLLKIDRKQIRHSTLRIRPDDELRFQRSIQGLSAGNVDLVDLHELYEWLELDQIPSTIRSLIVIPDSYLYQLPLDLLPVTTPDSPISYGSARYLVEEIDIRYVNSLRDLLRSYPKRSYEYSFTGIGISSFGYTGSEHLVPLPEAVSEVEQIAAQLQRSGPARTLINHEGTPAMFRESTSNSKVLHLASHSRISESDPLFSQIWLHPEDPAGGSELSAAESEANGQIFAWQLFDMDLGNQLIMLNSCDSGSGEYFQGAGVMGFSRALRYAGAQSLVLNSWVVNDHYAATFAIEFYRQLESGKSKSAALQETKKHFLSSVNANPHVWGAYILNGDNTPLFRTGPNPSLAILLLLLSAGFFLLVELHRRYNSR